MSAKQASLFDDRPVRTEEVPFKKNWNRPRELGGDKNGSVTMADLPRLDSALGRVYELMSDGKYHSTIEIVEASGIAAGMQRLYELRKRYRIDGRRKEGSSQWEYILVGAK